MVAAQMSLASHKLISNFFEDEISIIPSDGTSCASSADKENRARLVSLGNSQSKLWWHKV